MALSKNALQVDEVFSGGTRVDVSRSGRGLYVAGKTVPADGTTELLFGWTGDASGAPSDVTFTINGVDHVVSVETHQDHPEFAGAEDTLTASEPMTIRIEAEGEFIEIEAI